MSLLVRLRNPDVEVTPRFYEYSSASEVTSFPVYSLPSWWWFQISLAVASYPSHLLKLSCFKVSFSNIFVLHIKSLGDFFPVLWLWTWLTFKDSQVYSIPGNFSHAYPSTYLISLSCSYQTLQTCYLKFSNPLLLHKSVSSIVFQVGRGKQYFSFSDFISHLLLPNSMGNWSLEALTWKLEQF